ncbi:putative metal-binding motif-containing protein [Myxococcota bacterium]|nr:putative metal-binding motif-containing protein [Myxococcota bacterium]
MHFLLVLLLACGDKNTDTDSGSPDSGSPDGGSPDGGSPDGGGADGGGADGGGADGGGADGGGGDGGGDGGAEGCTWYADRDLDGYGDPLAPVEGDCEEAPEGAVDSDLDCDDEDAEVRPGADDLNCDNVDNDCDGATDGGWRVPEDQPDIQVALNSAPDGGIVCIGPGEYPQSFSTNGRRITVQGRAGAEATVITGYPGMPIIRVRDGEGEDTVLRGLTLRGGSATNGAGLSIERSSPTVEDLVIEENTCVETGTAGTCLGTGVYIWAGAPVLRRVTVQDNSQSAAVCQGAGIFASGETFPTFEDVLVQGNSQTGSATSVFLYGAGMHLGAGLSTLQGVEIRGNVQEAATSSSLGMYGGGLAIQGDVVAQDLVVADNQQRGTTGSGLGMYGPGVYAAQVDTTIEVDRAELSGNSAEGSGGSGYGGGLAVYVTDATLRDVRITDNRVDTGSSGSVYGGGLYARTGPVRMERVWISGNQATGGGVVAGGGAYFTEQELTADNLVVAGNTLSPGPSALTYGAGLFLSHGQAGISFADIVSNSATRSVQGLGVFVNASQDLDLDHVNIVGHTAGSTTGRALTVAYPTGVNVRFDHVNISDNGSSAVSGATFSLAVDGNLEVDPLYTDTSDPDPGAWDLHLSEDSPCVDAGDEAVLDVDGSRADVGAYGGPGGGW